MRTVTWKQVLRVWFAFTWRAAGAFCLLSGACFVTAVIAVLLLVKIGGFDKDAMFEVVGRIYIAAWMLSLPAAGLMAFHLLLKTTFGGQRLMLTPLVAVTPEADLPPLNWVEAPATAAYPTPRVARAR